MDTKCNFRRNPNIACKYNLIYDSDGFVRKLEVIRNSYLWFSEQQNVTHPLNWYFMSAYCQILLSFFLSPLILQQPILFYVLARWLCDLDSIHFENLFYWNMWRIGSRYKVYIAICTIQAINNKRHQHTLEFAILMWTNLKANHIREKNKRNGEHHSHPLFWIKITVYSTYLICSWWFRFGTKTFDIIIFFFARRHYEFILSIIS